MTEPTARTLDKKRARDAYRAFVKGLAIEDLRLMSATIRNLDCSYLPSSAEVRWRMSASHQDEGDRILVFHQYHARILDKGKEPKAKLSVTFCVTYRSRTPMTDELFAEFKDRNLPVNTWPYFREFVHQAVSRMGWPPFVAPLLVA